MQTHPQTQATFTTPAKPHLITISQISQATATMSGLGALILTLFACQKSSLSRRGRLQKFVMKTSIEIF